MYLEKLARSDVKIDLIGEVGTMDMTVQALATADRIIRP